MSKDDYRKEERKERRKREREEGRGKKQTVIHLEEHNWTQHLLLDNIVCPKYKKSK